MVDYQVAATGIGIGVSSATVTLTAIEYYGDRPMASGPGGNMVEPLTIQNTAQPVGVVHHHKWWEIVLGLAEDEYTALYNTNVASTSKAVVINGDNNPIGYFVVTEKAVGGKTRTITYESAKTYVQSIGTSKLTTEGGKYVVEVKLICIGSRTVSAWA